MGTHFYYSLYNDEIYKELKSLRHEWEFSEWIDSNVKYDDDNYSLKSLEEYFIEFLDDTQMIEFFVDDEGNVKPYFHELPESFKQQFRVEFGDFLKC